MIFKQWSGKAAYKLAAKDPVSLRPADYKSQLRLPFVDNYVEHYSHEYNMGG